MNRLKQDYLYGSSLRHHCKPKCYTCNNVESLLDIKVMQSLSLDVIDQFNFHAVAATILFFFFFNIMHL